MSAIIVTKRGKKYITSTKFEDILEVKKSFHETDFTEFHNKDKKNQLYNHRAPLYQGFFITVAQLWKQGVAEVSSYVNEISDEKLAEKEIEGTIIPDHIWTKYEENKFRKMWGEERWETNVVEDSVEETEQVNC